MELKIQKKKRYLILLLICLVLSAITAGIYLFVDSTTSIPYTVDKYTDTLDWCEPNAENGELKIDCKALLLSIKNQEDNSTCFDVQVISNTKELKDLTVCERGDTLTYTNDILAYKVLMPVDIAFTYTQGLLNRFSFKNVSFTTLDDTYIQSIVNEDIANLVTLDPSSTTIQNSVDFCPKPETLPSYVTEENKTKYTEFFNKNILDKNEYTNPYLFNWDDSVIRLLFACDSAKNMGYTNVCNMNKIQKQNLLTNDIPHLTMVPNWNKSAMDDNNKALLKEISLIYDSMFLKQQANNLVNLQLFKDLVININNNGSINEEVFCSMYSIYNSLSKDSKFWTVDKDFIYDIVISNLDKLQSISCNKIIYDDKNIDQTGLFYKNAILNNKSIYSSCINLNIFVNKNE